ncbi:DUF4192 domain-containing protein [Allobranchiibius sp. CTAmp26]|uniref:DUF4192 domain-containing protein n=1 Tax=Allobranchiibius sp. CTAmp26 TaxID=2815214 RepID=UPI001AA1605D|nr:DUF4192 domain-containing protein [Allobranchiibius sp. CTAmp26]MBO1755243.1 DUF4192 domain-containing protein [Allobranchiibius sp. CTAmp26]
MRSTLHGLGDLIAYLPYELGFRPTDSLVVVGLDDDRIRVVARLDLGDADDLAQGIHRIGSVFAQAGVREALCCVFVDTDPAPTVVPTRLLDLAGDLLRAHDVDAAHLLVTRSGSWWAHRCGCGHCPRRPAAVPDRDRVDAVVESVLDGIAPHASRAELRASLRECRTELAQVIGDAPVTDRPMPSAAVTAAMWEILHGTRPIHEMPVPVLASLSRAMANRSTRDEVFGWLAPGLPGVGVSGSDSPPGMPGAFDARAVRARLVQWLHCLPDRLRPPVLTLIAGSAWSSGSGALAAVAVEQALQIDPGYRLARLLGHAVELGARPRRCA